MARSYTKFCMICMAPYYGQTMISLVGKPGWLCKALGQKEWTPRLTDPNGNENLSVQMRKNHKNHFETISYTNINSMHYKLCKHYTDLVKVRIPRRTRHGQILFTWIKQITSKYIEKRTTQQRLLGTTTENYRKSAVAKLKNKVPDLSEQNRKI